jgi:hypothetical protein
MTVAFPALAVGESADVPLWVDLAYYNDALRIGAWGFHFRCTYSDVNGGEYESTSHQSGFALEPINHIAELAIG